MQNLKKLLAMMLMLASVFFFACSDDEDEKLSKEETKTEITQLSTDLSDKLAEMTESDGMVAMEALMTMPDPFSGSTKSNERYTVINNIKEYLLPYNYVKKSTEKSAFEGDPFDFDTHVGTYTYHNTPFPYWEIVPGGDKIIIYFPSDTLKLDVNDATITIHNYDEVFIDGDYLPTDIDADLYISVSGSDDIKVIDIDLTAAWNSDGEPTSLDVSVYLIPFEFTGDFSHTSTAASINFAILYDGAQFFSAGVGATWANAGDPIPSNVNGYLQFFEVKFQVNIDVVDLVAVIDDMENYDSEAEFLNAINNEIDAYVTVSGTWAADIELALDAEDELDILFVYADGTSESAIPYFEDLVDELAEFFGELEDYYSEW
ncbi:MAG: hypothetical protein KAQ75_11965 [Bacteroidales bacterium]|nr:hypothetical protein [Bacteroidales bacterium]